MPRLTTILLLIGSNAFMTFAWYAHLKNHRQASLWKVVLVSWGLAFFEYCLQVPANRIGMGAGYSLAELKTIQEVVTLSIFLGFSAFYFDSAATWNQLVGFGFIAVGAAFIFKPW